MQRSLTFLATAALLLPAAAQATKIVSDPTTATAVTHCAWYMDAVPRQLVVAPKDSAGKPFCSLDVTALSTGAHSVQAAFVVEDANWGTQEGPKSDPFAFTRPAAPPKPSGLTVKP